MRPPVSLPPHKHSPRSPAPRASASTFPSTSARTLDLEDDVVNRFTATVVLRAPAHSTFWSLAQDATAQLRTAREATRDAALMLASLNPADATEAEAAMLAATTADLEITNLGTSVPETPSVVAIWGPTTIQNERILGVVTHAGSLRLVLTTHSETRDLAPDIASRLAACSVTPTNPHSALPARPGRPHRTGRTGRTAT